jgi:hypothetical protein
LIIAVVWQTKETAKKEATMETSKHDDHKLKVFFREARVLSEAEIADLPAEKRQEVEENSEQGIWLEVNTEQAQITERKNQLCVRIGDDEEQNKGTWLNIFCPEDRCLKHSGVELP